jgi:hypothetical protein
MGTLLVQVYTKNQLRIYLPLKLKMLNLYLPKSLLLKKILAKYTF